MYISATDENEYKNIVSVIKVFIIINAKKLERAKGFEPSTSTLARLRSTPELRPLKLHNNHFEFISQYLRKWFI